MDLLIDEYLDELITANNPVPGIPSSSSHPAADHIENDRGSIDERMKPMADNKPLSQSPGKYNFAHICHDSIDRKKSYTNASYRD